MSLELKDLRAKITEETDIWLEVETQASGRERSEIVRDILHDIAIKRIGAANLLCKRMQEKGLSGIKGETK